MMMIMLKRGLVREKLDKDGKGGREAVGIGCCIINI